VGVLARVSHPLAPRSANQEHRTVACATRCARQSQRAGRRTERSPLPADPETVHYDYDGRRTDLSAGQDGLAFRLDRVFWPKPAAAEIKVTFDDNGGATWRLETVDASGHVVASPSIQNAGDGQVKTATFRVAELAARGDLAGEMDFRLKTQGPGDLTVVMVRVCTQGHDQQRGKGKCQSSHRTNSCFKR